MIKAVIFDMDGLMLDTERVAKRAWMSAATEHRIDLSESVYDGLIGLSGEESRKYFRGHAWDEAAVVHLETTAWTNYLMLLEREGVPHKNGLFEVLDFLDANQIPRAVATSTKTHHARRKLDKVGVLMRLDAIVGGEQAEHGKPAPDIYFRAAECLGHA